MPDTPTFPGVYLEEIPGGAHPSDGVPTSIAAFVGWTARGRVEEPTAVGSFAEFERVSAALTPLAWSAMPCAISIGMAAPKP